MFKSSLLLQGVGLSSRQLCCYDTDAQTRPGHTNPGHRFGTVCLCASCAVQRSTLGEGALHIAEIHVLAWLGTAKHELHSARDVLHAAVQRARQHEHSWQTIGDHLGISRQAAQQPRQPSRCT